MGIAALLLLRGDDLEGPESGHVERPGTSSSGKSEAVSVRGTDPLQEEESE